MGEEEEEEELDMFGGCEGHIVKEKEKKRERNSYWVLFLYSTSFSVSLTFKKIKGNMGYEWDKEEDDFESKNERKHRAHAEEQCCPL